ncbi:efflux RND transporter periplasmic adaptor subunit [Alcanivorax sp. 1008]|uniref:efflux RND transporter periplasmic adaptor subunit n=1 Tax=Alcanivorax sp. 1008 TaxID=2816853 RepID=UPI001DF64670|nr:efflux RND transporter periplasmic adaptor subunit [Alcanivorax sp. 1008]MCC1496160.1 efflux RND transporter periplasmic adaptor subunit [Alcanivorax sp. 1008]
MRQGAFVAVVALISLALLAVWQFGGEKAGQRQRPPQAVNVEAPRLTTLQRRVEAVGTARALQSVSVTSEVDGRVVRVAMKEGSRVMTGELLVSLDDRTAQAELAQAEASLADARAASQRAERLQNTRAISEAEVDQLKAALQGAQAQQQAAEARLSYHQIRAPFPGVIGLGNIDPGSYLRAGDLITTLDNTEQLEVQFTVPERYLATLAPGQSLTVTSDAWPEKVFSGQLTYLDSRIDPTNRAITVKALLDNNEQLMLPGQFLQVSLAVDEHQALMIPEQAILTQGVVSFAFVVKDGQAERRQLSLGTRQQGWVEVTSGIAENDQVIITGHTRLGSGSPVTVVDDPGALLPESAGAFIDQEG